MSVSKAKNIDIQNLYLLNMPAKLFIAGLAIAGVLAIGYVGIFKEQLETLSTQEAKEAELKETYTKKVLRLLICITFRRSWRLSVQLLMFC